MNFEQVKGIVERVVTLAVAFLVGKGVVPEAVSADLVAGVIIIFGVAWGWYVNRASVLAVAAEKTN